MGFLANRVPRTVFVEQLYTPEFHVSDPFERTNFARACMELVVCRHPLQRSLRNDQLVRVCDLAKVCGDSNILTKNIIAVGGVHIKNVAVM